MILLRVLVNSIWQRLRSASHRCGMSPVSCLDTTCFTSLTAFPQTALSLLLFLPGTIRTALMLTASLQGAPYFQLCLHTDENKNNSGEQGDEVFPERDSDNLFCFH